MSFSCVIRVGVKICIIIVTEAESDFQAKGGNDNKLCYTDQKMFLNSPYGFLFSFSS